MSCDAGFWKRPRSCPSEGVCQIWNQLKRLFLIYCIKGVFLMNVARKRVKQSQKIKFCDDCKIQDLCYLVCLVLQLYQIWRLLVYLEKRPQEWPKCKISNQVSMHIFINELQGPLPVSWIKHTKWITPVKLKLIWHVVTGNSDREPYVDGWTDTLRHTIIRQTFVGHIKGGDYADIPGDGTWKDWKTHPHD